MQTQCLLGKPSGTQATEPPHLQRKGHSFHSLSTYSAWSFADAFTLFSLDLGRKAWTRPSCLNQNVAERNSDLGLSQAPGGDGEPPGLQANRWISSELFSFIYFMQGESHPCSS